MKVKRFLSTVVAGALVAAQMAMPVMAADGGEVEVDVTTRTAVIRVEVPTTLAIAVNQFEKGDTGSQVYSEAFDITNKSEIPVKVSVTSTASLDTTSPITLTATKDAAAEDTSADGAAWLAVAAKTSASKYTEEVGKDVKDLTEANANVATFAQGTEAAKSTAKAEQTFYLAAEAAPSVTYTKVAPADADELAAAKKISYAKFYELTEMTLTASSEQDELDAAIAVGDLYQETSGALTLIEKGGTITWASGNKYYTAAAAETLSKDLATGSTYVYGEAGAGGAAGFRYIGKLSEGKETWTASDISKIVIKYDIAGVTGTRYAEVESDCTYGLYAGVVGPQVTASDDGIITIVNLTAANNYKASNIVLDAETYSIDTDKNMVWVTDSWDKENGGTLIFELNDAWKNAVKDAASAKIVVTLTDDSTIETPITIS